MTNIVVKYLGTSETFQLSVHYSLLVKTLTKARNKTHLANKMLLSKVSLEFLLSDLKVTNLEIEEEEKLDTFERCIYKKVLSCPLFCP